MIQHNWNNEAVVVWTDTPSSNATRSDFDINVSQHDPVTWKYLVEALEDVYGRIMLGEARQPWVLIKQDDSILDRQQIAGLFKHWLSRVKSHGSFGEGL